MLSEWQQRGQANFYFIPVGDPFMKNQLDPENSITLSIKGDDALLPASFYLFGLDTADGMANSAVPLVFIDAWAFNNVLSADGTEGARPLNCHWYCLNGLYRATPAGRAFATIFLLRAKRISAQSLARVGRITK